MFWIESPRRRAPRRDDREAKRSEREYDGKRPGRGRPDGDETASPAHNKTKERPCLDFSHR